jgi:hypothetical protein
MPGVGGEISKLKRHSAPGCGICPACELSFGIAVRTALFFCGFATAKAEHNLVPNSSSGTKAGMTLVGFIAPGNINHAIFSYLYPELNSGTFI